MCDNDGSDVSVLLHPLAIVSISSVFTRSALDQKLKNTHSSQRLIGGLLGHHVGREYHICDHFEFPYTYDEVSAKYSVDPEVFARHLELIKQVHQGWEVLGWFYIGDDNSCDSNKTEIAQIHSEIREAASKESILFMDLQSNVAQDLEELPIKIYVDNWREDSAPTRLVSFKMKSDKAEGIAMEHVSKVKAGAENESEFVTQLKVTQSAMIILNERVRTIRAFLKKSQENCGGKTNYHLLREIAGICQRLLMIKSQAYRVQYMDDYNDSLLFAYLATITKAASRCSEVVEKYAFSNIINGSNRFGTSDLTGRRGVMRVNKRLESSMCL